MPKNQDPAAWEIEASHWMPWIALLADLSKKALCCPSAQRPALMDALRLAARPYEQ